ncbi:MAG TPA: flagellar export protein FliJ [Steroidobacteraceae bacterium]|nr:flagellar export protein FliJ [Steroidobacteraceae bacterium]
MSQSKRLQVVQRAADARERDRARALAASERRVAESNEKLTELKGYQANYENEFARTAGQGIAGARLRDFQTFMARLAEAIRQQIQVVSRTAAERDAARSSWRVAAQRAQMVGRIIARRLQDERKESDRKEQRESDERAQLSRGRNEHAPKL